MTIDGLAFSVHKISITMIPIPDQDALDGHWVDGRPGVNDGNGGFSLGINEGKKPQFTITFKDEVGNTVTTGTFILETADGGVLK